ncbi:MAG: hypothetical protein K1X78_07475 [Verrucomicrobiaceae bacterium]|nr:hypothetical protein [Verrucomicrobiaceae bacterium]
MPNYFAAIPVDLPSEAWQALRGAFPAAAPLRWFAREDLHLTVAFFGRFEPERLPEVTSVLDALPLPDFLLRTAGLLLLPSVRRCSAVALALDDGGPLHDYMKQCHAPLMRAAGLEPDTREPLPHFTFARPGNQARRASRWMPNDAVPLPATEIHLHRLAIYGWADDRSARQFKILHERA